MAALHDALKSLGPLDIGDASLDDLKPFLSDAFSKGQFLVDSVPIPAPSGEASQQEGRSRASSTASNASEISPSAARSPPPPSDVEALQKKWKSVKMNPKENPLGMSVYKLGGKDGRGAWFARRSVHEGLGFAKWKRGLEREFPETMKVQGGPGEGNIRGIGGEKRIEHKSVEGVGKMDVYLLSAKFPGPTAPRDFVTMFMSSDQALSDQSGGEQDVPRHFMVISRPCNHPETPPRDGYIRGQYESVEFIREIPIYKKPPKSASTPNLSSTRDRASSTLSKEAIVRNAKKSSSSHEGEMAKSVEDKAASSENKSGVDTRARGATISNDGSDANGEDAQSSIVDDESECNPIEWIMITRSDPGGSVPRFMIERGTPGGIVSDASKFLDWACGKDIEDLASDDEAELDELAKKPEKSPKHDPSRDLHNYQTNGHLSGIEEVSTPKDEVLESNGGAAAPENTSGGLYGMVTGAAGAAGGFIAAHTPAIISDNLPHATSEQIIESPRRDSISSDSSVSSSGSFTSALEKYESVSPESATLSPTEIRQEKELQKLEEKKRKLDEKLAKTREKESSKSSEDSAKEAEAIKKAEEKHDKEKKKHEERYKREIEKLERKKEKEAQKAEEKLRKAAEKDEKVRLLRELEEVKAEVGILRKEREILRAQVGDLQAENTTLAAKIGRLSPHGEEVLKDVRAEVGKTGRMRASSLKGLATKSPSVRSSGSLDRPRTGESGGFAKS